MDRGKVERVRQYAQRAKQLAKVQMLEAMEEFLDGDAIDAEYLLQSAERVLAPG